MKLFQIQNKIYIPIFTLLFVAFSACEKNDDTIDDIEGELGNGEAYALINGKVFDAPAGSTAGFLQAQIFEEGEFYLFTITSAITLNEDGSDRDVIVLSLGGTSLTDLQVGEIWDARTENQLAGGAYGEVRDEENKVFASSELDGEATFRLTAIDRENRTISGEFSFFANDEFSSDTYTITNGQFNTVSYFER